MNHIVKFSNCFNNWSNALPIGNGIMGAIAFFEDGVLYLPVNHYEVYYNRTKDVFPEDMLTNLQGTEESGAEIHMEYVSKAVEHQPKPGEPFMRYGIDSKKESREYDVQSFSNSHPVTGELRFRFDSVLEGGDSDLTLDVEGAKVTFSLEKNNAFVCIEIITARQDCILISVNEKKPSQTESLIESVELVHSVCRDLDAPEITFGAPDENTAVYNVHSVFEKADGEDGTECFDFAGALRAKSAALKMSAEGRAAKITVKPCGSSYELIFARFTDWRYGKLPCLEAMKAYEDTAALYAEHKKYWGEFFLAPIFLCRTNFLKRSGT